MHVDEALLKEAVRKTTRREKYGQYLKIPIERWNWFSFSNQLKILHCTWMESPDSYTIVSILLWNRSRRKNLTQFDEAAVAESLWLTSFLLKLTDFNFLAGKICVEHWVLFHYSRCRSASSILFALKLCSLNMHHLGWCVKCYIRTSLGSGVLIQRYECPKLMISARSFFSFNIQLHPHHHIAISSFIALDFIGKTFKLHSAFLGYLFRTVPTELPKVLTKCVLLSRSHNFLKVQVGPSSNEDKMRK